MGWFWGSDDDKDGNNDPLRDLDPTLREFLKKESPVKYSSSNPPAEPKSVPIPQPTTKSTPTASVSTPEEDAKPKVPKESLFQDGRYAHLWKTYRPLADIEAEGKSDQEKLLDILEGYKQRKADIGRAALENCALEQGMVNDCFMNGGFKARMTMCRAENKNLERCYVMQSKFLKALGYLSTYDRPPEMDERIQMHADTLFHRMLDQEKQIEAAKAEGRPVPTFPPLLSSKTKHITSPNEQLPVDDNVLQPSDLKPNVQEKLKKRLEGLSDAEREVEERAIKAEIRAGEQVAVGLGKLYEEEKAARMKRKEEGKETIGDKINSIFNFRP